MSCSENMKEVRVPGLDWAVSGAPANSYITDISTWFARDHGDWLSTAAWVSLLGVLNVPSPSARTALHRMTKGGYLEREARNGRPGYALSKSMQAWVDAFGRLASDESTDTGPHQDWVVVTFRIPEVRRGDRHAMRTILGRLGFASLGNGVWITSAARLAETRLAIDDAGFGLYAEVFVAEHKGFSATADLIRRCWDIDGLAARYRRFLFEVRQRLDRKPAADGQTFADVIITANTWRLINREDPGLPANGLPTDWPRDESKDARNMLLSRFLDPAQAYVESLHN